MNLRRRAFMLGSLFRRPSCQAFQLCWVLRALVTNDVARRTARAIGLAVGQRCEGPIFTTQAGEGLTSTGRADRPAGRPPAGLAKKIGPHPPPPCDHHRRLRRRRPAKGRAGSRLPRRRPHHHALRIGPGVAGPTRHLNRRRLHRRSRPAKSDHAPRSPPGSHHSAWAPTPAHDVPMANPPGQQIECGDGPLTIGGLTQDPDRLGLRRRRAHGDTLLR